MRRRSGKHTFAENLAKHKTTLEAELATLPEGPKRDAVLQKIQGIANAARMDGWLKSDSQAADKDRDASVRFRADS